MRQLRRRQRNLKAAGANTATELPGHLRRLGSLAAVGLCAAALPGCSGGAAGTRESSATPRAELERYIARIEPIRLSVNRLLEAADPILAAFRAHSIAPAEAARRMGGLERRFASFTVDVAAINPRIPTLVGLHAAYAETYVLEDAYLSALADDLSRNELTGLPNTQSEQRAAIIRWRTGLAVLARGVHVALPADLQLAGRGEIAPAPQGGS